jgi:ligand-binding sensor domain-containing protein
MEYDEKRDVLYLGTTYGLMIYNISTEKKVLKTAGDGLPHNNIRVLELDTVNDILYIGTDGLGIYNLNVDYFTNRYTTDGLVHNTTYALQLDSLSNTLYIGTKDGLSIYNITSDTFTNKGEDDGLPTNSINDVEITSFALDEANRKLYIGARELSIYDIPTDTFTNKNTTHGLPNVMIKSLLFSLTDNILFLGTEYSLGTETSYLSIYNLSSDTFTNHNKTHGLPKGDVLALDYDLTKDTLYIGTDVVYEDDYSGGLSIYNTISDTFNNKTSSDGLPSNRVLSLVYNGDENLLFIGTSYYWSNWTYGGGLCIYGIEDGLFVNKALGDGLPDNNIQSLAFDSVNNRLYVGTMKGLSIIDIESLAITNLSPSDGLVGNNIHGLALDYSRQTVYIGLSGGYGISTYNWSSGELGSFYPENSPVVLCVEELIYDSTSDCLFIGTDPDGLFIHNLTTGTSINRTNIHGLPSKQIFSLELDKEDNMLYVGTLAGLAIYDIKNDSFKVRNTSDGLAENHVFGLELDQEHRVLYLGTWCPELSAYDITNDRFINYDTGDSKYGDGIGDMALNYAASLLYAGTGWDGLYIFDTSSNVFSNHLTKDDGLSYRDATPLLWDSTNSYLFIGSLNGLGIYDPYHVETPIISTSEVIDIDGNHTVSWDLLENAEWYVLERANSTNFTSSEVVYNGINTEYAFQDMPEGTYWYRVRGNNSVRTGNWSELVSVRLVLEPATLTFLYSHFYSENLTVVVNWSSVYNADNYSLEERMVWANGTGDWHVVYEGNGTSVFLTNRLNNIVYEYRVRASNLAGYGEYSAVLSVDTAIPPDNNMGLYPIMVGMAILSGIGLLIIVSHKKRKSENREKAEKEEEK